MGDAEQLKQLSALLRSLNRVMHGIAAMIGRPAQLGHVGEFIASQVFDIDLAPSASQKAIDGSFRSGPLAGRTVNVKFYTRLEGQLDVPESGTPDHYLVLAGPRGEPASSKGTTRPWCIESVYLFEAAALLEELRNRGVKIGVATSVARGYWEAAEMFPKPSSRALVLSDSQREMLNS